MTPALGKFSDARFASIFSEARIGASGEAYAFDEHGRMLSATRTRQPRRTFSPAAGTWFRTRPAGTSVL